MAKRLPALARLDIESQQRLQVGHLGVVDHDAWLVGVERRVILGGSPRPEKARQPGDLGHDGTLEDVRLIELRDVARAIFLLGVWKKIARALRALVRA